MPSDELLSDVLSEFARTMVTDFPIQRILDRLVERIVEVLPITAAGVTLISAGSDPHYVAASDASALRYEKLQTELGEGPCLVAYTSGEAVAVADLREEKRFPNFTDRALESGLAAVFTFPLRNGADQLGALDLYRGEPGSLDSDAMAAAQTLADVAASYLLNARARADLSESYERSRYNSLHDPLTGLPNRALLMELVDFAVLRARRSGKTAAVLFADLDLFKVVNDTHGHRVGDELLIAVADRLAGVLRPGDALARLSGDEFVMVCEDLDRPSHAKDIATRIARAFDAPFMLSCGPVAMTASVGITHARGGTEIAENLLHDADSAMYQAKAQGGDRHQQIIDLNEPRRSDQWASLQHDLQAAEAEGQLRVHYQPIVATSDRRIIGVESLVSWAHPSRGMLQPSLWIPLAEQAGLIASIGSWVLAQTFADWSQRSDPNRADQLGLAVNVSAHQLMAPDFAASIEALLNAPGATTDPALLTLEVTESVLSYDRARALVVLNDLRHLGVKVALDDFGKGYSSLQHLDQFPVDIIKIGQSFVAKLDGDAVGVIAAAIIDLTHALGKTVVAEGVETSEQFDQLTRLGCDACQGFYLARPMLADELHTLIDDCDLPAGLSFPVAVGAPRSVG